MDRSFIPVLLAIFSFASATYGTVATAAAAGAVDLFTINDVAVSASAQSPRTARDLAMAQGRPLAWSKLFRRITAQGVWASQPQLADDQLLGLISSVEASNEQRNTTRYRADIIFHFNPAAVRQLLRESNISSTETQSEPTLVIPLTIASERTALPFAFTQSAFAADAEVIVERSIDRQKVATEPARQSIIEENAGERLIANVRFDTMGDWARLRARLSAMKTVTEIDVVGLALNEAQIGFTYLGQMEQLRDALAQQNLALRRSGSEYTLELGAAIAVNSRGASQ